MLWPKCFAPTAYSYSVTLNYRSSRYKSHRYRLCIQFERKLSDKYSGVWNGHFYWRFPSKLGGRKKTKLQDVISLVLPRVPSYFKRRVKEKKKLFWKAAKFHICPIELAPDEAVKRSDPFRDSEKNGAAECVPAREDKSSIKFGLLPRKGNKSKWRSTQIFFDT